MEQQPVLVKNVVSVRYTGFDGKGRFLDDFPQDSELKTVARIEVDILVAEKNERPNLMINDSIHGIDLDGDPTNGVAKIRSKTFQVEITR